MIDRKFIVSHGIVSVIVSVIFVITACGGNSDSAREIIVPDDQPTIQAAIQAAESGDIVLVRPGLYSENIRLQDKKLVLASWYYRTADEDYIDQTIIDGGGHAVITARSGADETEIIGFTIQNGSDGISASVPLHIHHNRITQNADGIDYEAGGGGTCHSNIIHSNTDDGIDLDYDVSVIIENNVIRDNGDDGIEIRLHDYTGPMLDIVIANNSISGNLEDGIQIIDYEGLSSRIITIERNKISDNAMAGIGLMADGNTVEDYSGAAILERIRVVNNTLSGNNYGITGGANLIALNNIIYNTNFTAMRNQVGKSVVAYSLFWANGVDYENAVIEFESCLFDDPLLDANHELLAGSPAIDAGAVLFSWDGETVLDMSSIEFNGSAPDLGAIESHYTAP